MRVIKKLSPINKKKIFTQKITIHFTQITSLLTAHDTITSPIPIPFNTTFIEKKKKKTIYKYICTELCIEKNYQKNIAITLLTDILTTPGRRFQNIWPYALMPDSWHRRDTTRAAHVYTTRIYIYVYRYRNSRVVNIPRPNVLRDPLPLCSSRDLLNLISYPPPLQN